MAYILPVQTHLSLTDPMVSAACGHPASPKSDRQRGGWAVRKRERAVGTLRRPDTGSVVWTAGKTAVARTVAGLAGQELVEMALSGGTDTSDLLGGFEQLEPRRRLQVR